MQMMINSLNDTCRAYGMEINVKKTKVMIMGIKLNNWVQRCIMLGNVPLEEVTRLNI